MDKRDLSQKSISLDTNA